MKDFFKKYDPNVLMVVGLVVIAVSIIGSLVGFGAIDAYVTSTGFLEMNHPAYKAQETKYSIPVEGTVRIGEDEPKLETAEQIISIKNTVPATEESIENGKDLYETYCAPCHGERGDGQGLMGIVPALGKMSEKEREDLSEYLSGFIGSKPDINLNFYKMEDDAQLYFIISEGGEIIMPGFHDAMNPEQIWDLVNYIKNRLENSGV